MDGFRDVIAKTGAGSRTGTLRPFLALLVASILALVVPSFAHALAPDDLTSSFDVLYAPEGTYAPANFFGRERPAGFQPLSPPTNIAGLGQEAWLSSRLRPEQFERPPAILEIPGQIFNYIDIWFRLPDGSVVHDRAGDRYPYNEREVKHAGIAFRLPALDQGPVDILIRASNETSHSMNFAALAWHGQEWTAYLFGKRLWYGIFLGAIFALCVYNTFLAVTLWESAYLFYVGYILCLTASVVLLSGLAEEYLWPNGKPASFVLTLAAVGGALAVGFINRFLRIKTAMPGMYRFSSGLALLSLVLGLFVQVYGRIPFIPEAFSARTVHAVMILAGLYFISVSVISYLAGVKQARFLALSMLCLLASVFVYFSYTYGYVSYNLFIGHSLEFGALAEGILLSLALADRINLLTQQKQAAERQAMEYHRSFSRRLIEAQEKERRLLAETLHDAIGHGILVLKNNLGKIAHEAVPRNAREQRLHEALQRELGHCSALVDEVRRISHDLHPHILQRLGLRAAIESTMQRALGTLDIRWTAEIDPACETLDDNLQSTIYRAVQECLNNVMKHARATQVSCEIVCDTEEVKTLVCDNGVGFDASQPAANGLGLGDMEGRLQVLGGSMRVESAPGSGTTLEFNIPLRSAEQAAT